MKKPLVSIITPTYNASKFINETVQSVWNQTYQNFEHIIVDDCSRDNTWDILEGLEKENSRIKLLRMDKNSGAALARNKAIQLSKGKYIAFLDSDDLWEPRKLELQVQFMQNHNIAFSFTNYKMIDESGQDLYREVKCPKVINYRDLLKNTTIGCLTVMLDKDKIGKITMPNLQPEDTALWLRILKKGHSAYCLQETLASYRLVSNSVSSNKWKVAKRMWKVYRTSEKLNIFSSFCYFFNYAWNAVRKHYL
ncbi:glycosyltransferase family 2 protein [Lysinibacillus telephonicus]|uniref:Glycosyltransferase family 2 protein n=1 Tax=Lysinibacillus telephonicus TaxID=1714840 RepID=A0A431UTN7_9BACI|nr:glycosyltransferase family 2 protein [Lysinibacillus telephonicus]RTQ93161.1 glycosyltransferase family 2 protein [Lysinibacillus telephonicus]